MCDIRPGPSALESPRFADRLAPVKNLASTTRSRKFSRAALATVVALVVVTSCAKSDGASVSSETDVPVVESTSDVPAVESTQAPDEAPSNDAGPAAVVLETSEITVTGDPLVPFDDPSTDPLGVAPVVSGQSFDGSAVTIGGSNNGPTMLVFLAHWCGHCNAEIPELNQLRDAGSIPTDVNVVGVSTAVASDRENYPPSNWVVEKDWAWPVLADSADSAAMAAFGGNGFPYTVMLDSDGNVLARRVGSASAAEILSWIDDSLGL